jgi:hypothetical protein
MSNSNSLRGPMRLWVLRGQLRRALYGLRLDPGDQRAQRQLDVTRRALAIPTAQATDGDAEFPGEIARRKKRSGMGTIAR